MTCEKVIEWPSKEGKRGAVCVNSDPHLEDDKEAHVWSMSVYEDPSKREDLVVSKKRSGKK